MSAPQKVNSKKKPGRKKKTTHSSGMYRKRITLGHSADGKPIVKAVYGKTKEELENKIAALRVERGMGAVVTDDKSTFGYWAQAWKQFAKPSVSVGTWRNYVAMLKHLAVLNQKKINRITSIDVQNLISSNLQAGYSKQTLKVMREVASRIFSLARRNRAIASNPCDDVTVPKNAPVAKRQAVSADVQLQLWNLKPLPVNCASDKVRNTKAMIGRMFALMQLTCGLRRGEGIALEWADVDLKQGTLTINKAYDFKAQRVKEPKTAAGIRRIPIPDKYLQELNQWQAAHQDTFGDRKWVFAYKGTRLTESVFNEVWGALLDAMNGITLSDRISGGIRATKAAKATGKTIAKDKHYKMYRAITFTSHQLRHTYATNCIAAGIDVRTVQYLMGHGTAEMTLKYTHLSQYALSAARGKLNHTSDDAKKS